MSYRDDRQSRYDNAGDRDHVRDRSSPRRHPSPHSTEDEDAIFSGPLSILSEAVKNRSEIVVNCRHNKKLKGRVVAFDRHCNMILKNVLESWKERVKNEDGEKKPERVPKERFLKLMFLRGDSVIVVHNARRD